jgi:hypothetical protein
MTQPPIVPGYPQEPEPTAPIEPALVAPQPQIIYVQAPAADSQAVSRGIVSGAGTLVIIMLAVCLGIPLTCGAFWVIIAGIGKLTGS